MSSTPLVFNHEPSSMMPVATLEGARRAIEPSNPFIAHFRGLAKRFEDEDRERIIKLHRRGVRMQKAYEGDWGDFNGTTGAWMPRPGYAAGTPNKRTGKSSPWYPHNKIRRYVDATVAQTFQSRIDLKVIATRDDDRSELAALSGRAIVDYHEQTIFDELFITDEDKQKKFFGEVYFYGYWDLEAGPMVDELGVTQTDYMPGGSVYTCLRCGQSGDADDFGKFGGCPQCGSSALVEEQIPPMQLPQFGVVGKKHAGDCRVDIVPSLQVNYDRTAPGFERGEWLSRTRRIRVETLQKLFPDWKVPINNVNEGGAFDRSGTDLLEESTGNNGSSGQWRRSSARRTLIRQYWFEPTLYWDETSPTEVPFVGGETIPAKTRYREMFPEGMYILFGGDDILDVWGNCYKKHWVQLKHNHIPNRSDGDGIEDSLRPAQEHNETRSMIVASIKHNAARPQWTRSPIKEGDFTGQWGYIGHVDGLPYDVPMASLHHVADPNPLDQSVLAAHAMSDAEMRDSLAANGTVTGDGGTDSAADETARGRELLNDNANSQRLPEFALRALAYKKLHLLLIDLFRLNATEERWIPINGQAGELAGRYLKGADLDGDIDLSFGKGSYAPKDDAKRRANLMWAFGIVGPQGIPLILDPSSDPKWRQYVLDVAGVNLQLSDFTLDVQQARRRLEEMKRLCPQAQQMAGMMTQVLSQVMPMADPSQMPPQGPEQQPGMPPAMPGMEQGQPGPMMPPPPPNPAELLCQMCPIDPPVDAHEVHYAFYRNFCKTDEARRVDPVVVEAVHLRMQEHESAGAMEAGRKQMLAMQAAGPQMALEEGQQNKQQGREDNQRAEDRTHEMEREDKRQSHERDLATIKAKHSKAAANS